MAIPSVVPLGENVTADVYFYKSDNVTPASFLGGVVYSVFAPGNLKVLSGVATQDVANPAHWTASIVIPTSAPQTEPGQYYTIMFIGAGSDGTRYNQTQTFSVNNPAAPDQIEAAVVALANRPITITLSSPYSSLGSFAIQLLNSANQIVAQFPSLPTTPTSQNGAEYLYSYTITDLPTLSNLASGTLTQSAPTQPPQGVGYNYGTPSFGVEPYMAYICYTDPYGNEQVELQPVYIANNLAVQVMNNIREFTDRIRNNDNIPQLRVTEKTLLHFSIQGLMRVNSTPPQQIYFTFNNLPFQFYFFVQKAACYELMQAQYLAEGMSSFNFSGMSVQLDSDRTQYIATMVDNLRTDLETLVTAKKNYARSGGGAGIGTIGTVIGPNTNWVWRAFPWPAGGSNSFTGVPFLY